MCHRLRPAEFNARRVADALLIGVFTAFLSASASAVPLEIGLTGLNITYDGNTISDAGSTAGGVNDPADADPLDSVSISVGGVPQGVITSDISLDISIPDVTGISDVATSTVLTTPGNPGYFDLLFGTTPSAAEYLRLDTDEVTITYINTTSTVQFTFGAAIAAIDAQMLPLGLQIGDPVTVSFSTRVDAGSKTSGGGIVTGFTASGTGEIVGTAIPEPTSIACALLASVTMFTSRRRRLS